MSQWKNDDSAANSVLWGVAGYQVTANAANRDAFFGNTTADAYITGQTVGQFGVDPAEQAAARAAGPRAAHAGWVNRIVGSGGRAGRVMMETLVAMGSMTGDAEDTAFADYTLRVTTQPANATVNASSTSNVATFTVAGASTPTGATLNYLWQYWTGSAWASVTANTAYVNPTTATLTVNANNAGAASGTKLRARIGATGASYVYSSNAVITITT